MLIVSALLAAIGWFIRYRYLNVYSRLPPEPQRREPQVDLFPDTNEGGVKPGLKNYLDEFLSAIKLFGYLERPVFHELTRSMQTRKLIAGETWNLEEEKGFCILVNGFAEIFVKSLRERRPQKSRHPTPKSLDSSFSEEDGHGEPGLGKYQLLTEVENGVAMSSLFSVMSLFTEDIRLHHPEDDISEPPTACGTGEPPDFSPTASFPRSQENILHTASVSKEDAPGTSGAVIALPRGKRHVPLSLDSSTAKRPVRPPAKPRAISAHPDLIARATVDTTIAIIPASAFLRIIRVFPKATSHIVHVILSRFQRVTLSTAYSYLGLSGEVLKLEMNMISYTMCQLPNLLRGDALQRLKEKFKREVERLGPDEGDKGIALHNSVAHRPGKPSVGLGKASILQYIVKQRHDSAVPRVITRARGRLSMDAAKPGDLLTNTEVPAPMSAGFPNPSSLPGPSGVGAPPLQHGDASREEVPTKAARRSLGPFVTQKPVRVAITHRESVNEDDTFRSCILECIFKAIGLVGGDSPRDAESKEASPRLNAFDPRRGRAPFSTNAFGFMEPLDISGDIDSESMTSAGVAANATLNEHLMTEMKGEVEIVFFPKGSVLVEQGERNPGLYYVIDGFLDICVPSKGNGSRDTLSTFQRGFPSSMPGASSAADTDWKWKSGRTSVGLIKPGGLAGYMGSLSSYRSFIDVVAKTDVYIGFLPRASLERIVDRYPIVLLTMAKRLTSLLPRLISLIDFALEWVQVNAGQVIYHDGDESDAIYIVLNGRLRLVEDRRDGGVNVRAEYGQGDSVGELEVLTESVRSGTLHAIRDTELVKFPRSLFNSLAQEHPNITIKISKIIASRMRALVDGGPKSLGHGGADSKGTSTLNLRTVAILPVTSGVPVVEFGSRLMAALAQVGPANGATSLNHSAILNHLGKHAFNKMGKLKLSQYLADLEERFGLVVYVAGMCHFLSHPSQILALSDTRWAKKIWARSKMVASVGFLSFFPFFFFLSPLVLPIVYPFPSLTWALLLWIQDTEKAQTQMSTRHGHRLVSLRQIASCWSRLRRVHRK